MKTFALHPKMLTLSGVFYPTGYAVIMFPDAQQAEQAARELVSGGYDDDAIMLLLPETILREIGRVDGDSDVDLPSVGTEGATVQKYIKLARQGQHGLMVHAASDKDTERVMSVVRTLPFSYAQKYHILAMEDLE
ncbi:MAG: RNA-binding protein [Polaromonas sp.]|nr:RNA-binding protein [Polaromonas sp.]MDP3753078.1 RNA-binding protein [Polaromonas sp.]